MPIKPANTPEPTGITDSELLDLRADLIRLTVRLERVLEAQGYPIRTAVVTRQERRYLTRTIKKRNI